MHKFNKFISLLIFCFFFVFPVYSSENEIIKKIDVEGLQRISYETVLSYAELETNIPYSNTISNFPRNYRF